MAKALRPELLVVNIMEALKESGGNITMAALAMKVDPAELRRIVAEKPTLVAFQAEMRQRNMDYVEAKLMEKVRNGDTGATIFYAKCHGKDRGYVEYQQTTAQVNAQVNVVISKSEAKLL